MGRGQRKRRQVRRATAARTGTRPRPTLRGATAVAASALLATVLGAAAIVRALRPAIGAGPMALASPDAVAPSLAREDAGEDAGALGMRPARGTRPAVATALGATDRALLRTVFGIDDPRRLYVPDDEPDPVLRYAAIVGPCPAAHAPAGPLRPGACRTVSVRVGLTAPRRPGETWDAFVTRVARGGTRAWPDGARAYYTSLASLDPAARAPFERLLADARRAGFRLRVAETYRSPARQALLLARRDGRTETATSVHSYGRAVDLIVADGRIDRPSTVRAWIAFRRWVSRYRGGTFRVVGTPERTWDWPHVELAAPRLGFTSVEALLAAARACRAATVGAAAAADRCTLAPRLPPHVVGGSKHVS